MTGKEEFNKGVDGFKAKKHQELSDMKKKVAKKMKFDLIASIIAHEDGSLDDKGTKELYRHLDKKGLTNKLQGHYGRTRENMRRNGFMK